MQVLNDRIKTLNTFDGEIILVKTRKDAMEAGKLLSNEKYVGIDFEWKSTGRRSYSSRLAIGQFCTEKYCIILQLLYIGVFPLAFVKMLEDPNVLKIGCGLGDDKRRLKEEYQLIPNNTIDLEEIARNKKMPKSSLKYLGENYFNFNLDWKTKELTLSNWAKKNLTKEQIIYAASDSWIARKLYMETDLGIGDIFIALKEEIVPKENMEMKQESNKEEIPIDKRKNLTLGDFFSKIEFSK